MLAAPIARGLLFALAATVLATAITLKHRASQRSLANPEAPAPTAHPLTSELVRCKRLGSDQAVNPACKTAWRKNQERFFGSDESRANRNQRSGAARAKLALPGNFNAERNGRGYVAVRKVVPPHSIAAVKRRRSGALT